MIVLTGMNVPSDVAKSITINGAWVTTDEATIRAPDNSDWYDAKHQRVMNAVQELEAALGVLLGA